MNILFRADGNATIGAGHVMRCLALTQALKDSGGAAVFLSADLAEGFAKKIRDDAEINNLKAKPFSKDDAAETVEVAKSIGAKWVVVDGYNFDGSYVQAIKDTGLKVLRLDDHSHLPKYSADIILNQNAHAKPDQYPNIDTGTTLLLGTRFTMLSRAFRKSKTQQGVPTKAVRILITIGASDPDNLTPMIIRSLKGMEVELTVIVGGGNPHEDDVHKAIEESKILAKVVVNADNMHELMLNADLAITAAGSTCYELAYMGVPMVTIIVADNQVGVAEGLSRHDACINLGWKTDIEADNICSTVTDVVDNQNKRQNLQDAGKKLIDSSGAFRVLQQMNDRALYLREAHSDDCKMIFDWANDSDTRAASFSSKPIPWEDHTTWFATKLADKNHKFFVALDEKDEPIGQVRFDCTSDSAMISVSIAPNMRGKKFGVPLIEEGCRRCFGETNVQRIDAYIKPENEASKVVFAKAGFVESDPSEIHGNPALHFILKRT